MILQVFLQKGEINTATQKYVDIVIESIRGRFDAVKICNKVKEVNRREWTLAITLRAFYKLWKAGKTSKLIYWFQGLDPEELNFCVGKHTLRHTLRIKYFEILERLVLRKAKLVFFVSEAMRRHYNEKYGYKKDSYVVMPCTNQEIRRQSFDVEEKYDRLAFVYAGGMHPWQCIEPSIMMFSEVKKIYSDARLTILTGEGDRARALVEKYGLQDVLIKFVALEELDNELSKYKYGFMLRDDIIVNNVATPTKFNSYIANGIIPITTRAVHDYNDLLDSMTYAIVMNNPKDFIGGIEQIKNIEGGNSTTSSKVYNDFEKIFKQYYNTELYFAKIDSQFGRVLLK